MLSKSVSLCEIVVIKMGIEDKIVLITGGAGGIGKAIAHGFLKEGGKVCLGDLNEEQGLKVKEELGKAFGEQNVIFTLCDVTSDKSFEGAFETCKSKLGEPNVLVNSAGIFNEKAMEKTISINLVGSIRGTELAMNRMGKHKGGKGGNVINIASTAGIYPFKVGPFYSATKGGIVHYTRSIGDEFHMKYSGVIIQCLCPTYIATPLLANGEEKAYNEMTSKASKDFRRNLKLLQPEDTVAPIFKLIEEGKPGAALVLQTKDKPYYVEFPSIS